MTYSPALAQRVFTTRSWWRECAVAGAGVVLMAMLARASIPLLPVPITGQTLGVMLVGGFLGFRRGVAVMALYLAVGIAGAPVFASGLAGPAVLTGWTMGYLIGFLPAAGMVGLAAEHGLLRRYEFAFATMIVATVPIFALGLAWLSVFVSRETLMDAGFYPFIAGALAKAAIAALLLPTLHRFGPGARPAC